MLNYRIVKFINDEDEIYLQIPHHGATKEWDSLDNRILDRTIVDIISVGKSNSYHHPSVKKLCEYNKSGRFCKLKLVNEDNDYSYII